MPSNDIKIIAIDNGYYNTKYAYRNEYGEIICKSFRSKYEKTIDTLNENNTVQFRYNDEDYLVGDGATLENIEKDKTNNELHKILTYRVLSELSTFSGKEFFIIVGYPLNLYSTEKDNFLDYLIEDRTKFIETEYQYEPKRFKILDGLVLPQCAGAGFADKNKLKEYENKIQGIVDIGGLTVNAVIFNCLNVVRESIFTEDMGMIILYEKIRNRLYKDFKANIKDYQMPHTIKNGLRKYPTESLKAIHEVMLEHVKEIKTQLMKNSYDLDNLDLHFVGGGSLVLKDQIKQVFPDATITTDIYDNVKGFLSVGEMTYGS